MSHFSETQLEIRDQAALVEALEELGYRVESHAKPQTLAGWNREVAEAHVILPKAQPENALGYGDLGFLRGEDGRFRLIVDDYDRRLGLGPKDDAWLSRVTLLSGVHAALLTARRRGQRAERRTDSRGRIQVVITAAR